MSERNGTQKAAREESPSVLWGPEQKLAEGEDAAKAFHKRHRWLRYTMHFNRAKEAVVNNPKLDLKWRALEAIVLACWNFHRDYYSDERGQPLGQSDLAKTLGVDRQRVSEAVGELVEEKYLRLLGRIIFMVDDPALEHEGEEKANDCPDGSDKPSPNLSREEIAKAERFWAEHHPDRFQLYQKVAQEVREKEQEFRQSIEKKKQLREEMLEAYWTHQKQHQEAAAEEEPEANAADDSPTRPDNERPTRPDNDTADSPTRADDLSDPSGEKERVSLLGFKAFKRLASLVRKAVENSKLKIPEAGSLDKGSLANAATRLAQAPAEQHTQVLKRFEWDCARMAKRKENKPRSWGIIVTVMEDAIQYVQENPAQPSRQEAQATQPEQTPEEARETKLENIRLSCELFEDAGPRNVNIPYWLGVFETALHDPDVPGDLRERVERCLKRKPAESELGAQAQKAGQR